jgi:trans-aconitate methyltransferase
VSEIDLVDLIDSKIYHTLRNLGYGPVNEDKFEELVQRLTSAALDALDEYSDIVEAAYMAEPLPPIFLGGTNG